MRWLCAAWTVFALLVPQPVSAQSEPTIRIISPASGEVLQGLVDIKGTSAVEGFFTSELSFAYASDATNTWFLIYGTDAPVTEGLLAVWDTNLVTDGDYDLRLRVSMQDGTLMETFVTGLRIRNQTPTETITPEPTFTPEPLDTPTFTALPPTPRPAPTSTRLPTPTALAPNPVAVTNTDIYSSLGRGILVTLLVFILVGILIRLRRS
jgi:hypothetical protein